MPNRYEQLEKKGDDAAETELFSHRKKKRERKTPMMKTANQPISQDDEEWGNKMKQGMLPPPQPLVYEQPIDRTNERILSHHAAENFCINTII
jgi:hypothetical protein